MTEDWTRRLDAELPEVSPMGIDADDLVVAGRRGRRRRMMAAGGGAMSAVTAIAVVVAMYAGGGVSSNPAGDPDGDDPPPVIALPELDPDGDYEWWDSGDDMGPTADTEAYTETFDRAMAELFPDVEVVSSGDGEPFFTRFENVLNEMEPTGDSSWDATEVHRQPGYAWIVGDPTVPLAAPGVTRDGDVVENMTVEVWPTGGFTDGADGPTDLIVCESFTDTIDGGSEAVHDIDCSQAVGPNGETIRQSTTEVSDGRTGDVYLRVETTVVYRADGTAVRIVNTAASVDEDSDDPMADLGDRRPILGQADQIALATRLSDRPVR